MTISFRDIIFLFILDTFRPYTRYINVSREEWNISARKLQCLLKLAVNVRINNIGTRSTYS
jgi:hypothetical protein